MTDRIDPATAGILIEALMDGRLDRLFETGHVDYYDQNGFQGLRLGSGLPRRAVWDLIDAIRRTSGISVLEGAWGDYSAWVAPTARMVELLSDADRRATRDPFEHGLLPSGEGRRLKGKILINEAAATAATTAGGLLSLDDDEMDALHFELRESLSLVLLDDRPLASDWERLALHYFDLSAAIPDLAEREIDVGLIRELSGSLVEGFETPGVFDDGTEIAAELEALCAYASGPDRVFVHPTIKALVIYYWLARVQPCTRCSAALARIVAHLYAYKMGHAVAPYLPLNGPRDSDWAVPPPEEATGTLDATPYILRRLELFSEGLDALDDMVGDALKRDARLEKRFGDLDVNLRQARILDKAMRIPTTVFRIKYHARARGLAYETARQDFLELVAMGYLEQSKRGRAFEFRLAKGAAERLPR